MIAFYVDKPLSKLGFAQLAEGDKTGALVLFKSFLPHALLTEKTHFLRKCVSRRGDTPACLTPGLQHENNTAPDQFLIRAVRIISSFPFLLIESLSYPRKM